MKNETGALFSAADTALLALLGELKDRRYTFTTPTPATHARVITRPERRTARTIQDVFGWSLPFDSGVVSADLCACLEAAGMMEEVGGLRRSAVRVSSLGENLYLHSAYPTVAKDAVFFGPDSYRFATLIAREVRREPAGVNTHIVDIGTGAGVGAIVAADCCPNARVSMTDINGQALRFARINATAAGIQAEPIKAAGLERVAGPIDVALINPPYIIDNEARTYRDGGGMHGAEIALELAASALDRLSANGRLILYTGSAIVAGGDTLRTALHQQATARGFALHYEEIDPDVFGEELEQPAYRDVDRIALIAAILHRIR